MCITEIIFAQACGHAQHNLLRCSESRVGSCEHTSQRAVRFGFCIECVADPTLALHYELREARYREFERRARLDAARDIREEFNADLADGHILASIHPERISHAEARELAHEQDLVRQRLRDRATIPHEVFVWDIDRLDGTQDDQNRARVMGAALFRLPERILRGLTHIQLRSYVECLSEDLDARRHELRADAVRLQRARRILVTSVPRDPTGRTRAEREAAEQTARTHSIPSILTSTDISNLAGAEEGRACTICTFPFGAAEEDHEAEEPCLLLCGHIFGRSCIAQWLKEHTTCPYCRRDFKLELAGVPAIIQGPPVVAVEPLREIPAETRREAQVAQSQSRREDRHEDQDQQEDTEPGPAEDLEGPAGDANFFAEMAAATRASVERIHQQQLEVREAAHNLMIMPIRDAVRHQIQLVQSGNDGRRRARFRRLQELEDQLEDDIQSEAAVLISQMYYIDQMTSLEQHIVSLQAEREVIIEDMEGHHGDNLILRRHDDLLDDAYRLRHLLQQAERQADREIQRLRVDIEQGYVDVDDAYTHAGFHNDLDLDEDEGALDEDEVVEIHLDDQQPPVPNNSPALDEGQIVPNERDQLLRLLE